MWEIIYFIVIFYFFLRIKKENSIRRWVFGLYSFSAFCSILYPLFLTVNYEQNGIAYIYYIFCTLILLYPIWYFGKVNCKDFTFPEQYITWISNMLIVFGIVNLANTLPQLFTLRTFINNLSDVRSAYYHGDILTEASSLSMIEVLANWIMYVQFLSPFFAFLSYLKKQKVRALLLIAVSLCPAVNGLLIGEREASVVVLSNYIAGYILFRPLLSDVFANKVKKIGICTALPLVVFVVAMTISRFGKTDGGVIGGLLVYIGEQPFNFSYFFSGINIERQYLGGKLSFGYLFPKEVQLEGQINEYIYADEYLNVFAGIPGSLLLDFAYAAILVSLLLSLFFLSVFRCRRNKCTGKYDFSIFFCTNHLLSDSIYGIILF